MGRHDVGTIFMLGAALYLGQPDTGGGQTTRMIPTRAVDIYNETAHERVITVRTASRRVVLFRKAVSPNFSEPMFVRPEFWPCNTRLEVSSDGKNFQPIRGDICTRSDDETGDPLILIVSLGARPELVPVDPD